MTNSETYLSLIRRVWGVFEAPRATFKALSQSIGEWVLAMFLLAWLLDGRRLV